MRSNPAAFFSYSHSDDQNDHGWLSQVCKRLESEVQAHTTEEFSIFLDKNDLSCGETWDDRIRKEIDSVSFFIPVLSPRYFVSDYCRMELDRFIRKSRDFGNKYLIMPIYYIRYADLELPNHMVHDELAQEMKRRQWKDWRELREQFAAVDERPVRQKVAELARDIVQVIERARHARAAKPSNAHPRQPAATVMVAPPTTVVFPTPAPTDPVFPAAQPVADPTPNATLTEAGKPLPPTSTAIFIQEIGQHFASPPAAPLLRPAPPSDNAVMQPPARDESRKDSAGSSMPVPSAVPANIKKRDLYEFVLRTERQAKATSGSTPPTDSKPAVAARQAAGKAGIVVDPYGKGQYGSLAMAAVYAKEGARLLPTATIHRGEFLFNRSLVISGESRDTTILEIYQSNSLLIQTGLPAGNVVLQDVTIRHSGNPQNPTVHIVSGVLTLVNCRVVGGAKHAIVVEAGAKLICQNTDIVSAGATGVYLSNSARASMKNSNIIGHGAYGIEIKPNAHADIDGGCTSKCKKSGMSFNYSARGRVRNSTIEDNNEHGIIVHGTAKPEITDNTIRGNSGFGIFAPPTSIRNYTQNKFERNASGPLPKPGLKPK